MAIFHLVWAAQLNEDFGCRRGTRRASDQSVRCRWWFSPHPFQTVSGGKEQKRKERERRQRSGQPFLLLKDIMWSECEHNPAAPPNYLHLFSLLALSNISFSSCLILTQSKSQQQPDEVQQMDEICSIPLWPYWLKFTSSRVDGVSTPQSCMQNNILKKWHI